MVKGVRRLAILGAAGRDFHNFNTVYRDDPVRRGRRVHRHADPGHRRAPLPGRARGPPLPGRDPDRRRGRPRAPSSATSGSTSCVFSYSDVTHETVMHLALALHRRRGRLQAPLDRPDDDRRQARSSRSRRCAPAPARARRPATSRRILKKLGQEGRRDPPPDALRRPRRAGVPALRRPTPTSTCTSARSRSARSTSRTSTTASSSMPASTTSQILAAAEKEADVILWDGGNNDLPFYRPDAPHLHRRPAPRRPRDRPTTRARRTSAAPTSS